MAKLRDPYGSPPGRPAKYVFYITRKDDDDTQCMCVTFGAPYSARKFLDVLLRDDDLEWTTCGSPTCPGDLCTVVSSTGIVVSTRWERWGEDKFVGRLKRCVEHEYDLVEMAWDLDPQHVKWARQFREGPDMPRTLEEAGATDRRERRASAPSVSAPAGYVHVSDVALSMGIDAKQARVALRKIHPEGKPAYGWSFDPKTLDALKAKIAAAIKK